MNPRNWSGSFHNAPKEWKDEANRVFQGRFYHPVLREEYEDDTEFSAWKLTVVFQGPIAPHSLLIDREEVEQRFDYRFLVGSVVMVFVKAGPETLRMMESEKFTDWCVLPTAEIIGLHY